MKEYLIVVSMMVLTGCMENSVIPDTPLSRIANGWEASLVAKVDQSYAGWDVEIGDADNDGNNEILVTGCPDSRLYLFKYADSHWESHMLAENLAESKPGMGLTIKVVDLNRDGKNELILGTGQETGGTAFFYLMETDGYSITRKLVSRPPFNSSSYTHNFAVWDLDQDGVMEIISAYCGGGEIIRYDVDPALTKIDTKKLYQLTGSGEESIIADVDNDGQVEYLTSNSFRRGAAKVEIFEFDANGDLIPVDDPRLDPLWAMAGELGVPVLIHTADPVAFFQPLDEANERWEELQRHPDWHFGKPEFLAHDTLLVQRNCVIERHAGTIFIGAHLGNYPENLSYVDACLDRYPNFCVDTSARIGEIGRHPVEEVRAFFLKHQDRVLFGSDLVLGWDVFDQGEQNEGELEAHYQDHWRFFETDEQQIPYPGFPNQGRWQVDAIALPAVVLEKLYEGNARRLIPGL